MTLTKDEVGALIAVLNYVDAKLPADRATGAPLGGPLNELNPCMAAAFLGARRLNAALQRHAEELTAQEVEEL